MRKGDLVKRVKKAASEIGIPNVIQVSNDADISWRRVEFFDKFIEEGEKVPLGYICQGDQGEFVFEYNGLAFSRQKLDKFQEALKKQGLKAEPYSSSLDGLHQPDDELESHPIYV